MHNKLGSPAASWFSTVSVLVLACPSLTPLAFSQEKVMPSFCPVLYIHGYWNYDCTMMGDESDEYQVNDGG
jgi:hypothetical protein